MTKKIVVAFLATIVLASTHGVEAQPPKKMPRIGYLTVRASPSEREEALLRGLRELGYVDRQSVTIEYRFAGGTTRLAQMAAELVRLNVDVLVASATPAIQAAKSATTTIPIVMAVAADPVGTGLVASLARPGGNVTGMSLMLPELGGKRLELLREIVPTLSRVAFLAHGGDPAHRLFIKEAQDAGRSVGVRIQPLVVQGPEEFEGAYSAMIRERAGALVVQPLFGSVPEQRRRIVDLAARHRLPVVSDFSEFADAGGLMSYGPNVLDLTRRAAIHVDKILKGTKPADLPVEQPTTFELTINLKTAKQLGLTVPQSVLFRADKVIR